MFCFIAYSIRRRIHGDQRATLNTHKLCLCVFNCVDKWKCVQFFQLWKKIQHFQPQCYCLFVLVWSRYSTNWNNEIQGNETYGLAAVIHLEKDSTAQFWLNHCLICVHLLEFSSQQFDVPIVCFHFALRKIKKVVLFSFQFVLHYKLNTYYELNKKNRFACDQMKV